MKSFFSGLLFVAFFCACNGNQKDNSETDATSAPVTPGIDNVNGNVPDTTGAIRLNRPLPKDSTLVNDSPAHRPGQ
ncbi:MAG TPA: hypothetical protein VFL47_13910 [Flavisolibacter sp.]|nr:hypothetical protein [Flavisolibacter sp.]